MAHGTNLVHHWLALVSKFVTVIRRNSEGLALMHERKAQLAVLDAAIARGTQETDAGHGKRARDVFDRLEAKYLAKAVQ